MRVSFRSGCVRRVRAGRARAHRRNCLCWAARVTGLGAARAGSAAAAASPRVRASSLRRIAETWWSTVRGERTRRSATSAFAQPVGEEAQHLELARPSAPPGWRASPAAGRAGRARRALAGARARASPPGVAPSRSSSLERLERAPPRRRPRPARAPPRTGSRARATLRRRRRASPASCSRYGSAIHVGRVVERAGLPLPVGELAARTRGGASRARADTRPRVLGGAPLAVAGEPGRLRARGVDVAEPLEVPARPRELERLVERARAAPGSPRRARTRPSATSAVIAADRPAGRASTSRGERARPRPSGRGRRAPSASHARVYDESSSCSSANAMCSRRYALGALELVHLAEARAEHPAPGRSRCSSSCVRASSRLARAAAIPRSISPGHHVRGAHHVQRRTRACRARRSARASCDRLLGPGDRRRRCRARASGAYAW